MGMISIAGDFIANRSNGRVFTSALFVPPVNARITFTKLRNLDRLASLSVRYALFICSHKLFHDRHDFGNNDTISDDINMN